jgi:hypothetical protein
VSAPPSPHDPPRAGPMSTRSPRAACPPPPAPPPRSRRPGSRGAAGRRRARPRRAAAATHHPAARHPRRRTSSMWRRCWPRTTPVRTYTYAARRHVSRAHPRRRAGAGSDLLDDDFLHMRSGEGDTGLGGGRGSTPSGRRGITPKVNQSLYTVRSLEPVAIPLRFPAEAESSRARQPTGRERMSSPTTLQIR